MNIKAIIFDFDNTLIETEYYEYKGWKVALCELGFDFAKKDYLKYTGMVTEQTAQELVDEYRLEIKPQELAYKKRKLFDACVEEEGIELMPYAKEALDYFSKKDLKIGLCTSGSRKGTEAKLKKAGLGKYFDSIVTVSEVEHGKPAPDEYLLCAERLGVDPEDCLAIEDTQCGLCSAKDAGMKVYVVTTEFSEGHDFSRADKVLKSLKEFIGELAWSRAF